jgi:hypothetical protein
MSKRNRNNIGNSNKSIQSHEDQQQSGIQNQGKNPKSGMHGGSKVNSMGQGSVAGSTGTGNQGKIGNPVSGK